jgi:hypothetical protein
MTIQNPQSAAKDLIVLSELGTAALEYMACEFLESEFKSRYKMIRNEYIQQNFPNGDFKFSEIVETESFQAATAEAYQAYKAAKRNTRNSKRRMFTRYSKVPYRMKAGAYHE